METKRIAGVIGDPDSRFENVATAISASARIVSDHSIQVPSLTIGPPACSLVTRSWAITLEGQLRETRVLVGILNPRPKLEPGEKIMWKSLANHVAGPSYMLYGMQAAAGGQLVVTDRRAFFQPSRADRGIGAKRWECPTGDVGGIETVGKDVEIFAGGMRDRLGIRTKDGLEVFVVNRLRRPRASCEGSSAFPDHREGCGQAGGASSTSWPWPGKELKVSAGWPKTLAMNWLE